MRRLSHTAICQPQVASCCRWLTAAGGSKRGRAAPPKEAPAAAGGLVGQMFAGKTPPRDAAVSSSSKASLKPPPGMDASAEPTSPPAGQQKQEKLRQAQDRARAPFLRAIDTLQSQTKTQRDKREAAESKAKVEKSSRRKEKLTYRFVGEELDKFVFKRDLLHWFKYLRYGGDYIVDDALERMCRFFTLDAQSEIRACGKLFRGGHRLVTGVKFPELTVSKVTNFVNKPAAGEKKEKEGADKKEKQAEADEDPVGTYNGVRYNSKADKRTKLAPRVFRKPTLVLYSGLGNGLAADHNQLWRDLLKEPLSGKVSDSARVLSGGPRERQEPRQQPKAGASRVSLSPRVGKGVDCITIRTMDTYQRWGTRYVSNALVKRFAVFLPYSQAEKTYVGTNLTLELDALNIRNHLTAYAFLVDHRGMIRWMSSGEPDQREVEAFPYLLQQLEQEAAVAMK